MNFFKKTLCFSIICLSNSSISSILAFSKDFPIKTCRIGSASKSKSNSSFSLSWVKTSTPLGFGLYSGVGF